MASVCLPVKISSVIFNTFLILDKVSICVNLLICTITAFMLLSQRPITTFVGQILYSILYVYKYQEILRYFIRNKTDGKIGKIERK